MTVAVTIRWEGDRAMLSYHSQKHQARLDWPDLVSNRERRHELWQATCFECFLVDLASGAYLEWNFSPAGHWQLYSFSGYRRLSGEPEVRDVPEVLGADSGAGLFQVAIPWQASIEMLQHPARVGFVPTAVLSCGGEKSYWALAHSGAKADFHRLEGGVVFAADGT